MTGDAYHTPTNILQAYNESHATQAATTANMTTETTHPTNCHTHDFVYNTVNGNPMLTNIRQSPPLSQHHSRSTTSTTADVNDINYICNPSRGYWNISKADDAIVCDACRAKIIHTSTSSVLLPYEETSQEVTEQPLNTQRDKLLYVASKLPNLIQFPDSPFPPTPAW